MSAPQREQLSAFARAGLTRIIETAHSLATQAGIAELAREIARGDGNPLLSEELKALTIGAATAAALDHIAFVDELFFSLAATDAAGRGGLDTARLRVSHEERLKTVAMFAATVLTQEFLLQARSARKANPTTTQEVTPMDAIRSTLATAYASPSPNYCHEAGSLAALMMTAHDHATNAGACRLAVEIATCGSEPALFQRYLDVMARAVSMALNEHADHIKECFLTVMSFELLTLGIPETVVAFDREDQFIAVAKFVVEGLNNRYLREAGYDADADPYDNIEAVA